mgnify:CR=1 FL=1
MRLNSVRSVGGAESSSHRTVAKLTFTQPGKSITVGSSLVDGKRLYHCGNTVIQREKFLGVLTGQLHFAKHTFCWNISQHAVHDIVSGSVSLVCHL